MNPTEFAQKIKAKYPEYKDFNDTELAQKVVAKYPQYGSVVKFQTTPTTPSVLEKTGSALTTVFGGEQVGQTLGTEIAKGTFGDTIQKLFTGRDLSPEEEKIITQDSSLKQNIADLGRIALTFAPIGKAAGLITKGLTKLGLTKGAGTIGNIVSGGGLGAGADVAVNVSEGQEAELGLGTILGAGIPAASPIAKALTKTSAKYAGKFVSEVEGALTGTSAETVEQAFMAARKGGQDLDQFTAALRGKTTPEALVNTVRGNIKQISGQRQQLFKETLEELGDIQVTTLPAKQSFQQELTSAGVKVDDKGLLDFSGSKLKLVPAAQTKLQAAWTEVSKLPESVSLLQLDTTRQALKALSLAGDDPSANLANKLLDDGVRGVRKAGEQVEGYGKMLDNFGETSQFLDEIERGLSSGDRSTVDQAYRRLSTSLKTNNEQRMALIKELDAATDGAILSSIAGQQLSEALPRGIFRQIAAGIAGGAVLTGGVSSSLIPALVFASPRVAGEFVRSLGLATAKADQIIQAVSTARGTLVKIGAIGGAIQDGSDLEE